MFDYIHVHEIMTKNKYTSFMYPASANEMPLLLLKHRRRKGGVIVSIVIALCWKTNAYIFKVIVQYGVFSVCE